jgi:tetratricopeptide (TPR) repeat protein
LNFRISLAFLLLASCTPDDVLNRQGSTLRSTDYVQEAINAKKEKDKKEETAAQQRKAKEDLVKGHADRAQAHMDLFEYEPAIAEYKEAYLASNDPMYLEKIGDADRAIGDCVAAGDMYAQFLEKKKGTPDGKRVEAKAEESKSCTKKAGSNLDAIRKHYKDGSTHYDLAEYDQAVVEFKEAYRLSNDPAYLFNIAQAYRLAKNCPEAVRFYERFLAVAPDAPNRDKIQAKIAEMKSCANR